MTGSTDTRPTRPGWYWVRTYHNSSWYIAKVVDIGGRLCASDPFLDARYPIALADPLWANGQWLGPITPDDAAELTRLRDTAIFAKGNTIVGSPDLDRLRDAGDALVAVAKEAACALDDDDDAPLRGRLADAIAGWLGTRLDSDTISGLRLDYSNTRPDYSNPKPDFP